MAPCRYCLKDAQEGICLDCRSRFEALERENAYLKGQVTLLRRQAVTKYREATARLKRSVKVRRK
jgi:hypothetical protein